MEVIPIDGLPEVRAGVSLGALLADVAEVRADDVVVVSQKVVSKAEGRVRALSEVEPGAEATALAAKHGKDPRLVELVLSESREVLRAERGVLITETYHGWVCANAGIDSSNAGGPGIVVLLPDDPDASARRIRREIHARSGARPAVLIADSFGRAWRLGQADVAIGCAGLVALDDWRGRRDRDGRELVATAIAIADQAASAADLVRGKDAGIPAALMRGLGRYVMRDDGPGAASLRRPREEDLFR